MRIEIPREVDRFGPIIFHGVQKVYELDAGLKSATNEKEKNRILKRIAYDDLHEIQKQMAIVVPVRNEKIKLIEGVLCGIPHHCLVIIVSNSPRHPVDRFKLETDAIDHISSFMNRPILMVHQKDPKLAEACKLAGYPHLLDKEGKVKDGKAEGMLLSTILAFLCGKKYIGFIDSDNYFPGAVQEYVQEYCAGFIMSKSQYSMVRISWHSKPKIVESNLFFAKRGRASEYTNRILNHLISYYTGYGTEIIKTGNAGEHAMTMQLAMKLDYSSGYSIEPYHYINTLEKFGGILDNPSDKVVNNRIEYFQIESRNPHLHEVKGEKHVRDMSRAALEVIHNSPICPPPLKEAIMEDLYNRKLLKKGEKLKSTLDYYPALKTINMKKFADVLSSEPYAGLFNVDWSKFRQEKEDTKLTREKAKDEGLDEQLPKEGRLEAK